MTHSHTLTNNSETYEKYMEDLIFKAFSRPQLTNIFTCWRLSSFQYIALDIITVLLYGERIQYFSGTLAIQFLSAYSVLTKTREKVKYHRIVSIVFLTCFKFVTWMIFDKLHYVLVQHTHCTVQLSHKNMQYDGVIKTCSMTTFFYKS